MQQRTGKERSKRSSQRLISSSLLAIRQAQTPIASAKLPKIAASQPFLINSPKEIQLKWLHNISTVGLTAGASTPEDVVQACIETLHRMGITETEEVTLVEENVTFNLPTLVT